MTKNRMRPIHLGEILREEFLVPLGMTAHALSQAIRVSRESHSGEKDRSISASQALGLL